MSRKLMTGGCHSGAVRYDVTVDLDSTITCNCSRCQKLGAILTFAPAADFELTSGEDKRTVSFEWARARLPPLAGRGRVVKRPGEGASTEETRPDRPPRPDGPAGLVGLSPQAGRGDLR